MNFWDIIYFLFDELFWYLIILSILVKVIELIRIKTTIGKNFKIVPHYSQSISMGVRIFIFLWIAAFVGMSGYSFYQGGAPYLLLMKSLLIPVFIGLTSMFSDRIQFPAVIYYNEKGFLCYKQYLFRFGFLPQFRWSDVLSITIIRIEGQQRYNVIIQTNDAREFKFKVVLKDIEQFIELFEKQNVKIIKE